MLFRGDAKGAAAGAFIDSRSASQNTVLNAVAAFIIQAFVDKDEVVIEMHRNHVPIVVGRPIMRIQILGMVETIRKFLEKFHQ